MRSAGKGLVKKAHIRRNEKGEQPAAGDQRDPDEQQEHEEKENGSKEYRLVRRDGETVVQIRVHLLARVKEPVAQRLRAVSRGGDQEQAA